MFTYVIEGIRSYALVFPCLLVMEFVLYLYYKRKGISMGLGAMIVWQVFACIVMIIFYITNPANITDVMAGYERSIADINFTIYQIGSMDQILNLLLFIPLGIVIPCLWKQKNGFINTVAAGFLLSLFIELFQVFNMRASDINDLCANTLGTLCGYVIYWIFLKRIPVFKIIGSEKQPVPRVGVICNLFFLFMFYFLMGASLIQALFTAV